MARGYFNLYIEWKIYICGKMGIERVLLLLIVAGNLIDFVTGIIVLICCKVR